ncbi:hypothetical protein KP77_04760 [Jeotgalibacillus alimentarius]|uniref:Uncharacterized protein n=1 Tax=Jeotgalibacillus alimentarius TaxID=135826 RepID=A0A0C2RTG5_9BACL|nr:hypothetical protein [Jeotgalibacillus alimentarius]KIL53500.1 hypothetical protein KP77_04760 [Jeotgalibacillus alimentarius]
MIKHVTFRASTKGEEAEIRQSFSIEELNLEPGLSQKEVEEKIHELFERWVLDTVSFSITINRNDE